MRGDNGDEQVINKVRTKKESVKDEIDCNWCSNRCSNRCICIVNVKLLRKLVKNVVVGAILKRSAGLIEKTPTIYEEGKNC
jgi:hypothetical protein